MAIVLNKLNRKNARDHIYTDLKLDFKIVDRDVDVSNDEAAIANSLNNLFNTVPGERALRPKLGVDLRAWLGRAVSSENGRALANTIETGIRRFEPRVIVDKIEVIAYIEEQEYDVLIILRTPSLNTPVRIKGTLNKTHGFSVVRSST